MFDRWIEHGLIDVLRNRGIGSIVFSPLAQGMLTNKYLDGIPEESRAAKSTGFLNKDDITEEKLDKIAKLNILATERGQKLSQMAINWVLRHSEVTSALIGASKIMQIEEAVEALSSSPLSDEELGIIENILSGVN
jgi:L-glyceraldehyde 3-phosphate reductase